MNRIEEKAHPYADEIPQMEICDTEAVVPGQQKSDSITTHNDSQGSHQCRRNETFVFSDSKNKNHPANDSTDQKWSQMSKHKHLY